MAQDMSSGVAAKARAAELASCSADQLAYLHKITRKHTVMNMVMMIMKTMAMWMMMAMMVLAIWPLPEMTRCILNTKQGRLDQSVQTVQVGSWRLCELPKTFNELYNCNAGPLRRRFHWAPSSLWH